ncbi:MAG TPA: TrmH family RNA methyltransferase [Alphaproteobacteria bacterium]
MRGYFGIGVERSSKWLNAGNLLRTTHAFGGSFFFFVNPALDFKEVKMADTASSTGSLPVYQFASANELLLPKGCQLVGVELTDDAVDLPRFYHPAQAAYVLGPEMGSLSPEMQKRCDRIVKIPMKFCVNVGIAGAIIMYDRLLTQGQYPVRNMQIDITHPHTHIDTQQEFPHAPKRSHQLRKN